MPCCFYGWGALVVSLLGYRSPYFAVTITIGVAAVTFLGGLLNLAHLAFPVSIGGILVVGCALGIANSRAHYRQGVKATPGPRFYWGHAGLIVVVLTIIVFTVATQLTPSVFNIHDDFEKYFAHPVRMLATGTLTGSPLSAIGSEAPGGQPFLQGLILAILPIRYINAFDGVFCLALCLALAACPTVLRRGSCGASILGIVALVSINPHYANVSSLYSGAAFISCAVYVANERIFFPQSEARLPDPRILGLLYGGMVALKPTFVVFPPIHTLFLAAGFALGGGTPYRGAMAWATRVCIFSLLFLSPWLLLHWPQWIAGMQGSGLPPLPAISFPPTAPPLLSATVSRYGSSFADYTIVFSMSAFLGIFSLLRTERCDRREYHGIAATGFALLTCYLLILCSAMLDPNKLGALRYAIPYAIGGFPALFSLSCLLLSSQKAGHGKTLSSTVLLGTSVLSILLFWPATKTRITRAVRLHSSLSFLSAPDEAYRSYNQFVLSGPRRDEIENIQSLVPAGSSIIAWIETPFYLNFSRNRIIDVDIAGLRTPWARIPDAQYLIWQYRGYGVRSPGAYNRDVRSSSTHADAEVLMRGLQFYHFAEIWSKQGTVLYDNGSILVSRLASVPPGAKLSSK